jgi:hypothetical protein
MSAPRSQMPPVSASSHHDPHHEPADRVHAHRRPTGVGMVAGIIRFISLPEGSSWLTRRTSVLSGP